MDAVNSARAANGQSETRWRNFYVVGVLGAISFLNYYDRSLINILLQPITKSLHISDSAAGLLVGPAFALVYSILGVPIARVADRGYRARVLSFALMLWSVMTSLCGLATTLVTMFLARFGVGLGEAAGLPSTHGLVADYFPQNKRGKIFSIIAVISALGVMSGTALGGIINDHWGWRAAFMIAGAPGLIVGLIALFTLRERVPSAPRQHGVSLGETIEILRSRRSFLYVCSGIAVVALGEYASQAWTATYLIRHFGLTPGELGTRYAAIVGFPSIISLLFGGVVVDWWIKRNSRAPIWILVMNYAIALPVNLTVYLTGNIDVVFTVLFLGAFATSIYVGPTFALIQGLAGAKLRATAAAIFMLVTNLIGLGVGPLLAGFLSDLLARKFGADGLRYSLCLMSLTYPFGIVLFLLAGRTVESDLREADA